MIEARSVSVALGGTTIVSGADFEARAGEVTAIVGPNGSGKTTFLRALSGDVRYSGSIRIGGEELAGLSPARSAGLRAVLPQQTTLSFPFTVREVVALGCVAGRSGALAGEAVRLPERALARVGLEGFAGRFYQELSGGEQQRVQLARVLCQVWAPVLEGQPRWLFLDEPVSSLDIKHQVAIMRIAQDHARRGGGVIAVLHDLNLTAMFCDRVHAFANGRVVAAGVPAEVLQDAVVERVFGCALKVGRVPPAGMPFVLPQSLGA
jgi:iron complex transport system ATP-binding protein